MSTQGEPSAYALLTDGTTIEIRPARPEDFAAVRDLHAKMSPDNLYLRFFSLSPMAAEREARRICREPGPDHAALLAVLDGELVGCGTYECADAGSRSAEVALTVADDMQRRGVGTLLLEHLVSLARSRGVRAITAETLSENAAMLRVFADAGLQVQRALADGVYDLTFPLPGGETDAALGTYRDTVAERERSADVASLRPVLTPASVAVIGASRRPGSVGRVILQNIIGGGFSGPVYAVNPAVAELDGVPCVPSAAALPEEVDLAVIATPAAGGDRYRRRMRAAGGQGPGGAHGGTGRPGPRGAFGHLPPPRHADGRAGLASAWPTPALAWMRRSRPAILGREARAWRCSPPVAPALLLVEHLSRIGVGISSFVSLGDKDDVSGNDMLLWWESDRRPSWPCCTWSRSETRRKFARTARRRRPQQAGPDRECGPVPGGPAPGRSARERRRPRC